MVKYSSKLKRLLSSPKKKLISADDIAQESRSVIDRTEVLLMSQDVERASPNVLPNSTESSGLMLSTEWNESRPTPPSPEVSERQEAPQLENVPSLRSGEVERERKWWEVGSMLRKRTAAGSRYHVLNNRGQEDGKPIAGLPSTDKQGPRDSLIPRVERSTMQVPVAEAVQAFQHNSVQQISPFPQSAMDQLSTLDTLSSASDAWSFDAYLPPPKLPDDRSDEVLSRKLRKKKGDTRLSNMGRIVGKPKNMFVRRHQKRFVGKQRPESRGRKKDVRRPLAGRTSSGGYHDGSDQFDRAPSRKRSSILIASPTTLSRQSSVHFVTGAAIRKMSSTEAFSRRSSSRMISASPARSVHSSIRFSISTRRPSSGAEDGDL
jgi:hypothetical protein